MIYSVLLAVLITDSTLFHQGGAGIPASPPASAIFANNETNITHHLTTNIAAAVYGTESAFLERAVFMQMKDEDELARKLTNTQTAKDILSTDSLAPYFTYFGDLSGHDYNDRDTPGLVGTNRHTSMRLTNGQRLRNLYTDMISGDVAFQPFLVCTNLLLAGSRSLNAGNVTIKPPKTFEWTNDASDEIWVGEDTMPTFYDFATDRVLIKTNSSAKLNWMAEVYTHAFDYGSHRERRDGTRWGSNSENMTLADSLLGDFGNHCYDITNLNHKIMYYPLAGLQKTISAIDMNYAYREGRENKIFQTKIGNCTHRWTQSMPISGSISNANGTLVFRTEIHPDKWGTETNYVSRDIGVIRENESAWAYNNGVSGVSLIYGECNDITENDDDVIYEYLTMTYNQVEDIITSAFPQSTSETGTVYTITIDDISGDASHQGIVVIKGDGASQEKRRSYAPVVFKTKKQIKIVAGALCNIDQAYTELADNVNAILMPAASYCYNTGLVASDIYSCETICYVTNRIEEDREDLMTKGSKDKDYFLKGYCGRIGNFSSTNSMISALKREASFYAAAVNAAADAFDPLIKSDQDLMSILWIEGDPLRQIAGDFVLGYIMPSADFNYSFRANNGHFELLNCDDPYPLKIGYYGTPSPGIYMTTEHIAYIDESRTAHGYMTPIAINKWTFKNLRP